MSKKREEHNREEAKLLAELQQKIIPQIEVEQRELEKATGTVIIAEIKPIGRPQISVMWQKEPIKCFWKKKKQWQEELKKRLKEIWDKYCEICKKYGVVGFCQITPEGAKIFYALTPEKRNDLLGIIKNETAS